MTLDRGGRITAIDDPLHTPNWTFTYGASGEPLTTTWPTTTALTTTSAYDALGRLTSRTTTPGPRAAYTLAYNRAGSRLTEASTITGDPANGTAATGYDPLGRLTTYSAPGRTLAAAWDAVPDRTTLTTDGTPVATTFDAADRPTSGGYAYDADGRMTARSGQALAWDSLGRLAEVRTSPGGTLVARYGYDALDRLLTVERPGQATIRFRYAGTSTAVAQVVDDTTGTVIRNVTTGPEGTVLQDWSGTSQRLYGTNGHHDTTFATDGAGTVTATLRSDPWGNLTSSTGSLPDWRFQGSWADTSTGLAWSVARWYDPSQGTFISEDTLLGDPASPAGRHLYAYAEGDPVGGWDPGGNKSVDGTYRWSPGLKGWLLETPKLVQWTWLNGAIPFKSRSQWTGLLRPFSSGRKAYYRFFSLLWWDTRVDQVAWVTLDTTVWVTFRNGSSLRPESYENSRFAGSVRCQVCAVDSGVATTVSQSRGLVVQARIVNMLWYATPLFPDPQFPAIFEWDVKFRRG